MILFSFPKNTLSKKLAYRINFFSVMIFGFMVFFHFDQSDLEATEKGKLTRNLRKKAYEYFMQEEYSKSLPYLEKYLEVQPAEVYMRLVYAQALLYREDLPIPSREEESNTRTGKWREIRNNYQNSARIFEKNILQMESIRPREPSLGKWYFQWATAEWFSGNKEKAVKLYHRSVKKDFTLIDAYYNMGAIYESMGQYRDADKQWRNYVIAEKELDIED